ncbi:unnamed protein product [Moneuplotes crassus]|uniref:Uncharacterized protein n=1 Tax=Euplotes crassus TaxID=5936 RepID=A0AAD2CW86_EUPCR|nr:unnamed protein product [Moneuplotes crassus]
MEPKFTSCQASSESNRELEQKNRNLEVEHDIKVMNNLEQGRVLKVYYEDTNTNIYMAVENSFLNKNIYYFKDIRSVNLDLLIKEKYGRTAMINPSYARIDSQDVTNYFSRKTDWISIRKNIIWTKIGSSIFFLDLKDKYYKTLVYKSLSMVTDKFILSNFKLSCRDLAKIIMLGSRIHTLIFESCRIKTSAFPKGFTSFYKDELDPRIQIKSVLFKSCQVDQAGEDLGYPVMASTVMDSILSSNLTKSLETVTFQGLSSQDDKDQIIKSLEHNNVSVKEQDSRDLINFIITKSDSQ